MSRAVQTVTTMIDHFKNTIEIYETNSLKIEHQDKLAQDLLHDLELNDHSVIRKLRLANELKLCRQERRRLKDENWQLKPLYDILKKNEPFKTQLQKAHKEINITINRQLLREYHPRVSKK